VLRIVSGRFRGRKLVTPQAQGVRPTADRMKESVFNILQGRLPGARVLDLYAGAGNLGLEAASRGAHQIVFVERNTAALRALRKNLAALGLSGNNPRQAANPALELAAGQAASTVNGKAAGADSRQDSGRASKPTPAQETVEVIAGDAIRFLQKHRGDPFDLILADPPYDAALEEEFLAALCQAHVVPGGVVVFQHRSDWCLETAPEGFEVQRSRPFGKTVIDFLQRQDGREESDV
jgi:16S rRNA (guanine966-N2)-methyltransferase